MRLKPVHTFTCGPFVYATYQFPHGIYNVTIGVEL
jgi:hypothetical protein